MEQNETITPDVKTRDVYTLITDKIIEHLNQDSIPWHKPWHETGWPTNLITKKPYTGVNALLLGMEGYERNVFLSFDQVNSIGGKVKRGAKGHMVVRWEKKNSIGEQQNKPEWELKHSTVFNIAQCDKIPDNQLAFEAPTYPSCESIATSMPNCPTIDFKEAGTFYDVVEDTVHLPKKMKGKKNVDYYAAIYRQLVHSTGHDSRLARKGIVEMSEISSGPLFSKEDLIANIGTCFLFSHAGISLPISVGSGYIPGWIAKLQQDKRLVISAAADAQKAMDHILNLQSVKDEAKTTGEK